MCGVYCGEGFELVMWGWGVVWVGVGVLMLSIVCWFGVLM